MALPQEFLDARSRMNQAQDELQAHIDSGSHDFKKRVQLAEALRQRIRELEDCTIAFIKPPADPDSES